MVLSVRNLPQAVDIRCSRPRISTPSFKLSLPMESLHEAEPFHPILADYSRLYIC
jgi:hypothetical protein